MANQIRTFVIYFSLLLCTTPLFANEKVYRSEILKITSTLNDQDSRESALIEWLYGHISCSS